MRLRNALAANYEAGEAWKVRNRALMNELHNRINTLVGKVTDIVPNQPL